LEIEAEEADEVGEVLRGGGEELHEPHGEVEEAAGLAAGHEAVLGLRGAAVVVPPVDLHALAPVQLQHLLREHPPHTARSRRQTMTIGSSLKRIRRRLFRYNLIIERQTSDMYLCFPFPLHQ